MSNDLARRMARVMTEIVAPGNGGYIRHDHVEMAQAIIEDLGLSVEHGATSVGGFVRELEDQAEAEQQVSDEPKLRHEGDWEKIKHIEQRSEEHTSELQSH